MTTAVTPSFAETVTPAIQRTHGLLTRLLDGVTPDRFARMPEGVTTNHPAFILGHLSMYPPMVLERIGVTSVAQIPAEHQALFSYEATCVDDQAGTVYPAMDKIVGQFDRVMTETIASLDTIDPAELSKAPSGPPFEGMMPTMAGVACFVLASHPIFHAGQLSAWRRCMGLGPVSLG